MIVAALASALLWKAGDTFDTNAFLSRIHVTRAAYENCLWVRAKSMYRGADTPDLETAVAASCESELGAWADAMGAYASPAAKAAQRTYLFSSGPTLAHSAVQLAAYCYRASGRDAQACSSSSPYRN